MDDPTTRVPDRTDDLATVDAEIEAMGGAAKRPIYPINQGRAAMRRLFHSKAPRKHSTRGAFKHPLGWRRWRNTETGTIRWMPDFLTRPPFAKGDGTSNKERHARYAMRIERMRAEALGA